MRDVYCDGDRLVYVGTPANEAFWDDRWAERLTEKDVKTPDRFVVSTTKRYLPVGSRVIDAGCGMARTVYGLKQAGYEALGLDYAPATVNALDRIAPELDIRLGDVREMPFPDEHFDGVWSLGVVEHFYDGFSDIAEETARVLKPGGFAFVTVPSMSPLRILKARLGAYPKHNGSSEGFYQFALPKETVVREFEKHGFELIESRGRGGFLGLKEELKLPGMQRFYESRLRPLRAARVAMDMILSPFSFHTRLYVFRKHRGDECPRCHAHRVITTMTDKDGYQLRFCDDCDESWVSHKDKPGIRFKV